MNARLVLALAAMMAFSAAACDVRVGDKGGVFVDVDPRGRAEDQSTLTFPLAKGGQIELHTDDSNIEIVRAAGTSVEVQSRRVVRAGTDAEARKLLEQQPVTVEATPDRVIIRTVKADGPEARRRRGRVNYRLAVPVGSIVTARNENGGVTLDNVEGRFVIRSTNGGVEGKAVSGGFDIEIVNGEVVLQVNSLTSDLRVKTVNGDIVLGLPKNVNGTIEATSVNDALMLDDGLPVVSPTRDRGSLFARLGTGAGPRIDLQSTNGAVQLGVGRPPG